MANGKFYLLCTIGWLLLVILWPLKDFQVGMKKVVVVSNGRFVPQEISILTFKFANK